MGGIMIITIDGPAASGKSSVAQLIAKKLKIAFVSSGLLYRAATYLALKTDIDLDNEDLLLTMLDEYEIMLEPNPTNSHKITLAGQDISQNLHTDKIDANVSKLALHPQVRDWVDDRLRAIKGSFVVEGRDMGAKVFTNANYKFYLTASPEVRAKRRLDERLIDLKEMIASLIARDQKDHKQLKPAEDAIFIDTDKLNLNEVVETIFEKIAHGKDF